MQRPEASGKISDREMAQEMLNIRELYRDVRLCPHCRMAISKSAGCNKMVCTSCGQFFCFRCGKAITGYDHFATCRLFEQRDMDEWEMQMSQLIHNGMQNQEKPLGSTIRCPNCRERIFKNDDKYVSCWACRTSHCTLCKRTIQGKEVKSGHWGSPECVGLENLSDL